MTNVVIASAARTAVGSFSGAFAGTPAHDLGAAVLEAVVDRAGVDKGEVSEEGHHGRDNGEETNGRASIQRMLPFVFPYIIDDASSCRSIRHATPTCYKLVCSFVDVECG